MPHRQDSAILNPTTCRIAPSSGGQNPLRFRPQSGFQHNITRQADDRLNTVNSAELILGNSNPRFSGVTSTMLQTLDSVARQMPVAVLGRHHLPGGTPSLSYREFVAFCRRPLPSGLPRVFHARRNNEMMQALAAKHLFGARIRITFTSTAQREHTWITRWLITQMDGLITTCSGAAAVLEREPDVMIPHGVDLDAYHPPASKSEAWKSLGLPGTYGIGIFGRVRHQKGIDLLIDAALPLLEKYPDPTIVVVGELTPKHRDYQNRLEEKIATAGFGGRVVFLGKRPARELPGLFRAMSLVAALSRNEGFGLTVLEAMASECAVLASHAGAWQDIVREGIDGHTVPCDDREAVQDKLDLLLADPEQLTILGKAGRHRVEERYSIEREANALCEYYRRLQKAP